MGNRLQKTDSSTGTTGYGYDAANRLLSATGTGASTYANDADGNTLTDTGGRTMNWDSQNRMVSCAYNGQTTTNTYGADGLRRSSTVNGVTTYYAYDGQTLIREMHKNVTTGALYNTATYLQGMRGPEYRRDDTQTELDSQGHTVSKCRWYVYDGLGSVVGEVDVNGNLTSSPKYDVYGLVRSNAGTASSAMGFVGGLGHLSEAGTGLIYMRARYYDPSLGRFASEDPGKNGKNWFAYCDNNSVNEIDRTGKAGELLALPVGLVLAYAVVLLANAAFQYRTTGVVDWDAAREVALETVAGGLVVGLAAASICAGVPLLGIGLGVVIGVTLILLFMGADDDFGDFSGPLHDPSRTVQPILG